MSQQIHKSPLAPVDIPDSHLVPFVLEKAASLGDKPALIDGPSGRTLTYAQLAGGIRSFAGGLKAKGFAEGEVVGVLAPNLPEYAIIFHGTAYAGGAVTTINPTYTAHEVKHQLEDAGARFLITIELFLETAKTAAEGTSVEEIFVLGDVEGASPFSSLLGKPLEAPLGTDVHATVALPYSSGTTGLSKGVMLTHHNLVANICQTVDAANLREEESYVAVLPFFHIYGMQVLMNCGLRVGATVITMPRFDLVQFLELNAKYECSRAFVAPPIIVALAKHPIIDKFDLTSLDQIFSGAAPLSAELAHEAGTRLNCEVVQGYGMTELSPVSHLTTPGGFKPGSVGVIAPNTECLVVDPESQKSLGVDEIGEIWVRGPQVMKGYLNNEEATALTIDADGWLHTGDIGKIDSDGHAYIVDRLKELIKFKGFQVPPAELEALLLTHPAVADAAVIGLPDAEAGELPIGYVVLKPGQDAQEDDIKGFVAEKVATYKKLHRVHMIDAIPKSAAGKILRRVLRSQAAE